VNIPESLPAVDVDAVLTTQVLSNLVDNADRHCTLGHTYHSGRRIEGRSVLVSMTDAGPGVPACDRDAVFESFVAFDARGRSGLGLSIAKTFVEAHGEQIWVEDVVGWGARFVFTLPVSNPGGDGGRAPVVLRDQPREGGAVPTRGG
jgi:two-component system sensor histidine kinase KdpD